MTTAPSLVNTNSIKLVFARRFLRTLLRIKREKKPSSLGIQGREEETRKRVKKIKIAAYSSMARAVGTNVAWSKAMLLRLRSRKRSINRNKENSNKKSIMKKSKKKKGLGNVMRKRLRFESKEDYNRLRKVIPGGGAMDTCSLIEEAAHYIQCLGAQVKVMQNIAHELSIGMSSN